MIIRYDVPSLCAYKRIARCKQLWCMYCRQTHGHFLFQNSSNLTTCSLYAVPSCDRLHIHIGKHREGPGQGAPAGPPFLKVEDFCRLVKSQYYTLTLPSFYSDWRSTDIQSGYVSHFSSLYCHDQHLFCGT